jgi:hypothetical protein
MAEAADSPGAADVAGATDDPKAAFKAALDRKRGQQAARNEAGGPTGGGKIHGEHSAAGGKRTFRRKSGG